MKQCIPASIVMCSVFFGALHAADSNTLYTVRPYQDSHDHDEAFTMITSQLNALAGKEKAEKEQGRLYEKLHNALHNNTPMNKISFVEESFRCSQLYANATLAGVVTYLIKKDDGNCFIDTLCIKPEYGNAMYTDIVKIVLNYACQKKAEYIEIFENKTRNKDEIDALTKIGFTETIRDKNKPDSVTLKLHTSALFSLQ